MGGMHGAYVVPDEAMDGWEQSRWSRGACQAGVTLWCASPAVGGCVRLKLREVPVLATKQGSIMAKRVPADCYA